MTARTLVGFAAFAVIHPGPDLSGLVFLKDLFVSERVRSRGIGEALMRFLAVFCLENSIGRIDFPTDLGNQPAQDFYTRIGAERLDEAGYHRIAGERLARLAAAEL